MAQGWHEHEFGMSEMVWRPSSSSSMSGGEAGDAVGVGRWREEERDGSAPVHLRLRTENSGAGWRSGVDPLVKKMN
jgi:hypothetical protein